MYIKMKNIDALHNKLLELKVLVFLLVNSNDVIPDDDYFLSGLALETVDIKSYLTDLIYESVKELSNLVYAEDFFAKTDG